MKLTLDDLLVPFGSIQPDSLLASWGWLVPQRSVPLAVSTSGNLFIKSRDDRVHLLDAGCGQLRRIAESVPRWEVAIGQRPNADQWLSVQLVAQLLNAYGTPGPEQCFGFKLPPMVGGDYEIANFEHTNIELHFALMGQIAETNRRFPNGTPIRSFQEMELRG